MWKSFTSMFKGDKPQHDLCQDYCLHKKSNMVECITLCDGASSGEHSDIGAEFIANYVTEYFLSNFDLLWNSSYSELNTKLVELHQSAIVDLSEHVLQKGFPPIYQGNLFVKSELYKYGTTIQVCCIKDDRMLFYKVGNGSAVIIDGTELVLLSGSSHEAETDHFTFASTLDTIMSSVFQKFDISQNVKGVLLFSDGVDFSDGFYDSGMITNKTMEFINSFLSVSSTDEAERFFNDYFEKLSQYSTNYAHDDMSMAMLLRKDFSDKIISIASSKVDLRLQSLSYSNEQSHNMCNSDQIETGIKETTDSDLLLEINRSFSHLDDQTIDIAHSINALKTADTDTRDYISEKIVQKSERDKNRFLLLMLIGAVSVALSAAVIIILLLGTFGNG